jgi:hypothetical protein
LLVEQHADQKIVVEQRVGRRIQDQPQLTVRAHHRAALIQAIAKFWDTRRKLRRLAFPMSDRCGSREAIRRTVASSATGQARPG